MAGDQADAVAGFAVAVVVVAQGAEAYAGGADDGGGEAVFACAEGAGGDGGQVESAAAALVAVDLLEGEDVGVQGGDGGGEPVGVHQAVGEGSAVQQVERGQAHRVTLRRRGMVAGW
ncbi:hypothetical protein JD76_01943 [Micromonospora endolithica]|nr:hypothetical protein JD76_01943 [Micromonospora endolithica]